MFRRCVWQLLLLLLGSTVISVSANEESSARYRKHLDQALSTTVLVQSTRQGRKSDGAGVLLSADGYILTAKHIVLEDSKILVTTRDAKRFYAIEVTSDFDRDLALLRIQPLGALPFATLSRPDNLVERAPVMVTGNPHGDGHQLLHAKLGTRSAASWDGHTNEVISIDIPLEKGFSGGGTFDRETGHLLGLNVARREQSRDGLIIPSPFVESFIAEYVDQTAPGK